MIAYLRGRVAATTAETVIIDVNGVGYEAYCSGSAFAKIGNGDTAELYTYLQVREDGMTLFGFSSLKEKELFLKLISVSGVGPKWESPFCPYSAEKRSCPPSRRPTSNV